MGLATAELTSYVEELELVETPPEIQELAAAGRLEGGIAAAEPEKPSADVDKGSLVSFVAGITQKHRADALNSTLFAQLASDYAYNRLDPSQVMKWYEKYVEVLGNIGWAIQEFNFQNYEAGGSTFSVDSAIIKIVASFLPAGEVKIVEAALTALSELSSDNPWYKVWESSSHSANGGSFQVLPCSDEEGKGPLVMGCTGFSFTTTEDTTRFLWVDYHSSDTSMHYSQQISTLDDDVYSQVRNQIVERLGAKAEQYVGTIPLGG